VITTTLPANDLTVICTTPAPILAWIGRQANRWRRTRPDTG
jgi:hypothetical protein